MGKIKMLKADAAKELLASSQATIDRLFEKADSNVKEACSKGLNFAWVEYPGGDYSRESQAIKESFLGELSILGYNISNVQGNTIHISW